MTPEDFMESIINKGDENFEAKNIDASNLKVRLNFVNFLAPF